MKEKQNYLKDSIFIVILEFNSNWKRSEEIIILPSQFLYFVHLTILKNSSTYISY